MRLGVPGLLTESAWNGLDLLVTAPLPTGVRRLGADPRLPEIELLREITELSPTYMSPLAESAWWLSVRERVASGLGDSEAQCQLSALTDRIEQSYGEVEMGFGSWHGDFSPWNLARLGTRTFAWDWEGSTPDAPIGFDAVHFHFQIAFVAKRLPLEAAASVARQRSTSALHALGVRGEAAGLVPSLHLLELFVRHEEARASSGGMDDRFYPAVASVVPDSLGMTLDTEVSPCERRSA
jgi:hypothetical protein